MKADKVFVFDLEDTLYKEIEYLKSGYQAVADYLTKTYGVRDVYQEIWNFYQSGVKDVFQKVLDEHHLLIDKADLIDMYRSHKPRIQLDEGVRFVLEQLRDRFQMAVITDGRTQTKRNIIEALGLSDYIGWSDIYISEEVGHPKTEPYSFMQIMKKYPNCNYVYVGDNLQKDFVMPNLLGWDSFCLLDDGQHIHKQDFTLNDKYIPKHTIYNLKELLNYV